MAAPIVERFINVNPTVDDYLRGIVLFGRNVASYKFALAASLVELAADGREVVTLSELAEPFARHLCEHLQHSPRQATSSSSRFLDTCRRHNTGEIDDNELNDATVRLGFNNVIDAFHLVGNADIDTRFFVYERNTNNGGIRLTDNINRISTDSADQTLAEIEARWRLVETAWALDINTSLIAYDDTTGLFLPAEGARRQAITSARDSLNGYQKGRCFYCYRPITITSGSVDLADVDHVFPHVLQRQGFTGNLDQVWNLVLACRSCNRGPDGKFAASPHADYVARLEIRNDYLVASHHPLSNTLALQTGADIATRHQFLQDMHNLATTTLVHTWRTAPTADPTF